eukprot:scaffold9513_cov84-Phaeocystis_antarctica.AAC.2
MSINEHSCKAPSEKRAGTTQAVAAQRRPRKWAGVKRVCAWHAQGKTAHTPVVLSLKVEHAQRVVDPAEAAGARRNRLDK